MYTLYIGNKNYSSWSLRPWLLLTELGIDFEEQLVPFNEGYGGSWEAYRKFSPTGLVPCLVDETETVWESLAIVEYLAERERGVWPTDSSARAWARSASAEMHAGFTTLRSDCPMTVGMRIRLNRISDALKHDLKRMDELWQQGFDAFGGPFLAGSKFTAVDALFAPVAFRIQTFSLDLAASSESYAQRLLALEGMQRWAADALAEPWRERAHEEELNALGEVLEDLRH